MKSEQADELKTSICEAVRRMGEKELNALTAFIAAMERSGAGAEGGAGHGFHGELSN
ncbi:MAG: hypothetical protein LBH54_03835 [Clostridiales bacterium]|jgi:hypothetical protein|nr:hypothetical protein [Clostridiales bacterium]